MQTIDLPFFGKVSINKNLVEQEYQTYVRIDDALVEFNLIYETESLEISDIIIIKQFLDNFDENSEKAKQAILKNYKENGFAKDFIQTHLDALMPLGKELLKETFAKNMTLEDYFLDELELDHIYIFPDDNNELIKFNYRVSEEFTDEILVVRFGNDFKVKEITIEY